MATRKFDIEIDLDSKAAQKDLTKFNKTLDKTNKELKENGKGTKKSDSAFAGLSKTLGGASKALGAVGVAATAGIAAFVALDQGLRALGESTRELSNLSRIAGVTTQEFQSMSFAAEKFGFGADKVSDVIKDFNDKLGDFTATGAGPFADVLALIGEESGLTAEKLSKMSGKDGIAAVVDALDSANISGKEQTFILESLAGDLSTVTPLFKDSAKAIDEAGDALLRTNAFLTDLEIEQLAAYKDQTQLLDVQFAKLGAVMATKVMPAMSGVNKLMSDFVTAVSSETAFEQGLLSETPAKRVAILKQEVSDLNDAMVKVSAQRTTLGALWDMITGGGQVEEIKEIKENREKLLETNEKLVESEKELAEASGTDTSSGSSTPKKNLKQIESDRALAEARAKSAAARELSLQNELELLKATTDAEKVAVKLAQEKAALNLSEEEASRIANITREIEVQKKLNDAKEDALDIAKARDAEFKDTRQNMERELQLLKATTDAERERIQLEHEITDSGFNKQQADSVRVLNEQIIAQEKRNELLEKEKAAVVSLGEAMGNWASGSKDAIKQVIAELIRLVAIQQFGGTGSLVGGFLSGFGGGGMRGFADGGQFRAGETFMVGERGPEIITSQAAGSVIPNHQLGGGGASVSVSPHLVINGGVNGVDELTEMFAEFSEGVAEQTSNLIKSQLRYRGVLS